MLTPRDLLEMAIRDVVALLVAAVSQFIGMLRESLRGGMPL